ncbi:lipid-A-disaccharide synthase [Pseudomonadales bacterium]|nr:lipid-A-disaccharide synthase [Pseudomonadales bacterium]
MTSTNTPLTIGIVAGEKSGDALGAGLIDAIQALEPSTRFTGLGGQAMIEKGFVSIAAMERLSVMGLIEPLKRLPDLIRLRRQLYQHFINLKVDIVVGIDSPDFNLGLEKKLKRSAIPTCHYVCPSVWAWRQGRVKKIRASVDHVLALLPFEVGFLQQHGIEATFVGHPLADRLASSVVADTATDNEAVHGAEMLRLCVMPGSRSSEVDALLECFLQTALLCVARIPQLEIVIPAATPALHDKILNVLQQSQYRPLDSCLTVQRCFGRDEAHACVRNATVVLLASGTATLEAALLGKAMVVAYRMSSMGYAIASRLIRSEHIALPNLLLGERVVPELVQHQATPQCLSDALLELLVNSSLRRQTEHQLEGLRDQLALGADQLAASTVLSLSRGGNI